MMGSQDLQMFLKIIEEAPLEMDEVVLILVPYLACNVKNNIRLKF